MKKIHFDFHSAGTSINVIVICLAIIMEFSVASQEYNVGSISLSLDNDSLLGSDRGYTNGLFFKFNSSSTVDIKNSSPFIMKTIGRWLPLQQKTNKGWGITVGQQIWTPTDLTSPFEGENDRPFTGFLFIKANIFEFSAESANKYRLMLGAVGPDALGENSQKFFS